MGEGRNTVKKQGQGKITLNLQKITLQCKSSVVLMNSLKIKAV